MTNLSMIAPAELAALRAVAEAARSARWTGNSPWWREHIDAALTRLDALRSSQAGDAAGQHDMKAGGGADGPATRKDAERPAEQAVADLAGTPSPPSAPPPASPEGADDLLRSLFNVCTRDELLSRLARIATPAAVAAAEQRAEMALAECVRLRADLHTLAWKRVDKASTPSPLGIYTEGAAEQWSPHAWQVYLLDQVQTRCPSASNPEHADLVGFIIRECNLRMAQVQGSRVTDEARDLLESLERFIAARAPGRAGEGAT